MKECTYIVDHLNVLNTLMCQFTSIGVKIKEEDKVVMLLCTLLKSWDHLVTTISCNTKTLLNLIQLWELCCQRKCGGSPIQKSPNRKHRG